MKKTLSLLTGLLLLGCDGTSFRGETKVYEEMTLLGKKGDSVQVSAGLYQAKLSSKGKKKVRLKLKQGDWKEKFYFQIPEGRKLPLNGEFSLTAAESGQPYDISGKNDQVFSASSVIKELESCSYRVPDYYCYDSWGNYCGHYNYRIVWGTRRVEYQIHTETRTSTIELLPSRGEGRYTVARFTGRDQKSKRSYLHFGICYGHSSGYYPHYYYPSYSPYGPPFYP